MAAKAVVTPSPQQIAVYEATSEPKRINLLISLTQIGKQDLAAELLKRYPLTGKFARNRTLFIEGMVLRGHGNLTGAAQKFRDALADDPSLTLVRSELAKTLFELGENDSAKHHLTQLMAEAPDAAKAQGIRSFIDTIDERRPYKFSAFVSVAPSTNVNRGSSVTKVYDPFGGEITIDPNSRKKSGIGVLVGGNAGYNKRLGNSFSVVLGGNLVGQIYDDKDYNSYGTSESAEMRYLFPDGHLGLGMVSSQGIRNDGTGLGYYSFGPRVSLQKDVTPRDRLNLSTVYEWRNFPDNSLNDATALMMDATWSHGFSSDLSVSLDAGFDRVVSDIDYDTYSSYSAGLGIYKELSHGITAAVHGQVRQANFDGIFPIYGKVRKDTRYMADLTLTKRDLNFWGYAPELEYTYSFNDSNLASYYFDSHSVNFTLSKDF
jgi:outer membrane protein